MSQAPASIFVISGPSGVGKGTVCAYLRQKLADNLALSISATSRAPREAEQDGVHYYFKTREAFEALVAEGGFLEWAEYNGNYYGTLKAPIRESLKAGKSVLLEIEVQGAAQVRETFPDACMIFIVPPSMEVLEERLRGRGTNDEADLRNRMAIARHEVETMQDLFDFVVVNDNLEICEHRILDIIQGWWHANSPVS